MIQPYEGKEPFIFVSYSHKDSELVLDVIQQLHDRGFRIWYDAGIEYASEWPEYIASHLSACTCVLAFVSQSFVESDNCRRELTLGLDLKKPLLTVYTQQLELSMGLRLQLGLAQAVNMDSFANRDQFVEALANARIFESCKISQEQPEEAPVDNSQAQQLSRLTMIRQRLELVQGKTLAIGRNHLLGLCSDGSACAVGTGAACKVSGWKDLIAVAAGNDFSLGLRSDGTVLCAGEKKLSPAVDRWQDVIAISAAGTLAAGLRGDGTVLVAASPKHPYPDDLSPVSTWQNITAVSVGAAHVVALQADGTVVATGSDWQGQCQVSQWTNIVAISAGHYHTVGLHADGTAVATVFQGDLHNGQCDVAQWHSLVAISAGDQHTVGLRSDGSLIVTAFRQWHDPWSNVWSLYDGQGDVAHWNHIVAVCAGPQRTAGLRADGLVCITESSVNQTLKPENWQLFASFEDLEKERIRRTRRRNQNLCLHCGGSFTGLFSKKCRSCGKPKDY